MGRIDNDMTKGVAKPFLILAHVRCGGTFLAHGLSNHPQVFCDRGETLHHLSSWRQAGIEWHIILKVIWSLEGYHSTGFRAIYRQAFKAEVWNLIRGYQPKIIHLTRKDETRQCVSYSYQQMIRSGDLPFHPVHSFESFDPMRVHLDKGKIESMVRMCLKVREENRKGKEKISSYDGEVLDVTYEEITGNRFTSSIVESAAGKIERFLGVDFRAVLPVGIVRDVNLPLEKWFHNWEDLRKVLGNEGFRWPTGSGGK